MTDSQGVKSIVATADSRTESVFMRGIRSDGQLLFCRESFNGSSKWIIGDESTQTQLPSTDGSPTGFAALSDWHAVLVSSLGGGETVHSYRNGSLTPLVDTSGTINSFREVATNNQGDVVFMAVLDSGRIAILSDSHPEAPIISTGDVLLGSPVRSIMMFPSLNDSGQFAFRADLADNRVVLFRADVVPEPSCLVLGLLGMTGLARRRRWSV